MFLLYSHKPCLAVYTAVHTCAPGPMWVCTINITESMQRRRALSDASWGHQRSWGTLPPLSLSVRKLCLCLLWINTQLHQPLATQVWPLGHTGPAWSLYKLAIRTHTNLQGLQGSLWSPNLNPLGTPEFPDPLLPENNTPSSPVTP